MVAKNIGCKCIGTLEGGGYEKMFEETRRVYGTDGISPTITAKKGGHHEVKIALVDDMYANREPRVYEDYSPAIRAEREELKVCDSSDVERSRDDLYGLRIRKLTPKECIRLMDFDDEDYMKLRAIESNTQIYAQAGNSIVVNCLVAIFGQMFEGKENVYAERFSEPTP